MSNAKKIGPVVGSPPTLEWVPIGSLEIDPAYQRNTRGVASRRIIAGMKKKWDWSLCQPLVVSRREDSRLFVIDGQHRLEGSIARSDIPHLPCVVLSGRAREGEAKAFVALNTKRQRLSQFDIFNGMLASGDESAHRTAALIDECGWSLRRSSATDAFKPGDLVCAPALARACKKHGEAVVRNALTSLREAYSETPITNSGTLLGALILLYSRGDVSDPDALIGAIAAVEVPGDWSALAAEHKINNPLLSRKECLAAVMKFEAAEFALAEAV